MILFPSHDPNSKFLGEYSNAALAFMSEQVCRRLHWFPTPAQCLEILDEYQPPVSTREQAVGMCERFWQERFNEWIVALKAGEVSQEFIDAKPDQWRRIAEEQGLLRQHDDGVFRQRVPSPAADE